MADSDSNAAGIPSMDQPDDPPKRKKGPPVILLMPIIFVIVLVPFLFWYDTWFGKRLDAAQIEQRLTVAREATLATKDGKQKIREAQHALEQLSQRIQAGKGSPKLLSLAIALGEHNAPILRRSVIWLLNYARDDENARTALVDALDDNDRLVRCSAALQVALFDIGKARPILHAALVPARVESTLAGKVIGTTEPDIKLREGMELIRVDLADGRVKAVYAPFDGTVTDFTVKSGDRIHIGTAVCSMKPSAALVVEVFTALALAGDQRDIAVIDPFSKIGNGYEPSIMQAASRAKAIIRERLDKERLGKTGKPPAK